MSRLTSSILELAFVAAAGVVGFVLIGGGTTFQIGGVPVSVRSVTNPLLVAAFLGVLRYLLFPHVRLTVVDIAPAAMPRLAHEVCVRFERRLNALTHAQAIRRLGWIMGVSAAIKLANALWFDGFFSGDDVEVHEMTFAAMFGWEWNPWHLRNAFYPMTFLYPVQQLVVWAGVLDPGWLVFAGRCVVVLFSSVTLWLVYIAARDLSGRPGIGLLASFILAASRTHVHFASTELPRTVAAAFLVSGFIIGMWRSRWAMKSVGAGTAIGLAGTLRFSELLFIVPEAASRIWAKEWRRAVVTTMAFTGVSLGVLALSDWLYWGVPFFSLRNIVEYTLVDKLSSRGFEPWHFYVSHLSAWTNPLVISASIWCAWCRVMRLSAWTWLPVALLSLLPHKEARYMVPVLPFLSMGAALGLAEWLGRLRTYPVTPRTEKAALALVVVGVLSLAFEAGGFRFRRSEDGVRLARWLGAEGVKGVAAEQVWRLGGRLYLQPPIRVIDVSPEQASGEDLARHVCLPAVDTVVLLRPASGRVQSQLTSCGFSPQRHEAGGEYYVYRRAAT